MGYAVHPLAQLHAGWLVSMLPWLVTNLSIMNFLVKLRLIGLALGIGLMGFTILFMTVKSQRQATDLRLRLAKVDSESFRIADQFRDYLRQLNDQLYHYGRSHTPPDVAAFTKASHELDLWIDVQKPKLTTERERAIMQQIDTAYDDYLRVAKELLVQLVALGDASATIDEYNSLRKESQHLSDLGQDLAKAHFSSRGAVLAQANQTINGLRLLVLVSLGCLFVFAMVLTRVVYRDMIAPLQVQLIQNQVLLERQEKLASLGMLAAGVAHEIRNPLTAVKAALFIQLKHFQPGTPEFSDVKIVEREILRLEKIVNDFLLFGRPTEPKLAKISADATLREVQALLVPQLAKNNIQLLLEETLPLHITADAAQLKQVLINLVQNAADAIGQDGMIKLRVRRDRKRIENRDTPVVILEVADNGKGIPTAVQKRLFDPFFTTKDSGTGLGLSIVANIIHKHGGALEYQTKVNYGTTFGIILPQTTE